MSQALRDYQRSCLSKNGGNKPIVYLIVPSDVQATAMANHLGIGHVVRPSPLLNAGAKIYAIEVDRRTLRFSESERVTGAGISYNMQLLWNASPMVPELLDLRRRLRHRRVHALWTDNATGKTRIMQLAEPSYSGDSETTRGNRNSSAWIMRAESKYPAPFLDTILGDSTVTNTGGLVLIHTPSAQRFALTVDIDGSLITTPIATTAGVPLIPINNNYSLVLDNEDGTLGTIP